VDPQLPVFNSHFRLLRYDTRGHGQSSVTPGLIPSSFSQTMSCISSTPCASIALISAASPWADKSANGLEFMRRSAFADSFSATRAQKSALQTAGTRESVPFSPRDERCVRRNHLALVHFGIYICAPGCRGLHAKNDRIVESTGLHSLLCRHPRFGYRQQLPSITIPTLVIAGDQDLSTPPADGRFIASQIPGARFIELSAAHLSNIEAADRFTQEVQEFLLA